MKIRKIPGAVIIGAFLALAPAFVQAAGEQIPFPQGVTYAFGIKPNNFSQAQMNADVQAMYDAWRAKYVTSSGAGEGNYRVTKGPAEGDETVSEGMGFGMFITAYMASATNSHAQVEFDGMYRYYQSKVIISNGVNYGLMAWRIAADGTILDPYAAPDGDLDVAYALLVAHKQWGSNGAINYLQEAITLLNNLQAYAVHNRLDPGASYLIARGQMSPGWEEVPGTTYTMSSYQMTSYFTQFADVTNDVRWDMVMDACYRMYNYFHNLNPGTSLTPFTFVCSTYGPSSRGYNYGFDACRVPWRVGLDYLWHGTANSTLSRDLPNQIAKWAQTTTGGDPANIYSSYELDGRRSSGAYLGAQRNMISPIAIGAMTDASNQTWLNTIYAWMRQQIPGVNSSTSNAGYYQDTVLMCCMLVVTGNTPYVGAPVTPSAPSTPTNVSATAGDQQVALSWSASSGATSYNIKRATTSGGPYTTIASGVTATSFSNTGLTNGVTYHYVVSAVNSVGESANSAQVSATPAAITAPAAPTDLTASQARQKKRINLSWTASSGAASYNVKRSTTSGGPYTTIATTSSTSYANTGLTSGTTYFYVVSATSSSGESAHSNQASATAK